MSIRDREFYKKKSQLHGAGPRQKRQQQARVIVVPQLEQYWQEICLSRAQLTAAYAEPSKNLNELGAYIYNCPRQHIEIIGRPDFFVYTCMEKMPIGLLEALPIRWWAWSISINYIILALLLDRCWCDDLSFDGYTMQRRCA